MASCTRRRWPSETRFMRHAGFTSRTFISRSRRAGSTPVTLLIMVSALMSPWGRKVLSRQRRYTAGLRPHGATARPIWKASAHPCTHVREQQGGHF